MLGSDVVGAVHLPHQEAGQAPAEDPGQQHHLRAVPQPPQANGGDKTTKTEQIKKY